MAVARTMLLRLQADASQYTKTMQMATKEQQILRKELDLWSVQSKKAVGSAAYLKKELEMQKQQQELLQVQIRRTTTELERQSNRYGEDSRQAQNLRGRLLDLQVQQERLNHSISEQPSRIWSARGEAVSNVGSKMQNVGMMGTMSVTAPIVAGAVGLSKLAMDAVESENLFQVSMGKMAEDARNYSNTISKAMGLNSNEVRKNIGTFNAMFNSMGVGEKSAYDMSKSLTQLSYDMASFYNLSNEDAFEKIQSGISGETEPLKRLGIIVNETTVKNYALTNGMIKQGEQLSETGKIAARYGVIMDATSKAQGDLARTADSPANQIRRLQNQAMEAGVELGKSLIPALTSTMKILNESVVPAVKGAIDMFNKMPKSTQSTVLGIIGVIAVLPPIIWGIGALTSGIGSLIKVVPTLITGLKNMATALTAPVTPAGIIITAIGMVAGTLIYLYNTNEDVRKGLDSAWSWLADSLPQYMNYIGNQVQNFANNFYTNMVKSIAGIGRYMQDHGMLDWAGKNKIPSDAEVEQQLNDMYIKQGIKPVIKPFVLEVKTPRSIGGDINNILSSAKSALGKGIDMSSLIKGSPDISSLLKNGDMGALNLDKASSQADKVAEAIKGVRDAVSSYMDKLKSATDSTQQFVGLFDRFQNKAISLSRLIKNMTINRDTMINWQGNIAKLQQNGLNTAFIQELIKKGVSGSNEVKSLAKSTPEQIAQLNSLWADQRWNAGNIASMQLGNEAVISRQTVNQTIKIDIHGNEIKDETDIDSLVDKIVEALSRKGVLVNG